MNKIYLKFIFFLTIAFCCSITINNVANAQSASYAVEESESGEQSISLPPTPTATPEKSYTIFYRQHSPAIVKVASDIWNYEVFVINQNRFTIKTIVLTFVLLCFGFWASRKLSKILSRRMLKHFGLQRGEVAAMEALLYYILVVFFILFTLQLAHVPLTVFTVLGGAVAIGVGFGSQNIMNNFISGIILLLERPIRVGDLVEVEGLQGRVQTIGARSTRIITNDNVDLVVPNSLLLEKNVINWTLSDEKARGSVTISVEYASDIEQVKALLIEAADQVPAILRHNPPFAVFSDFSDNALVFKIFFWYSVNSPNNRLIIESDLRTAIARVFKQHNINIPYPKRDMSLATSSPLDIRLVE